MWGQGAKDTPKTNDPPRIPRVRLISDHRPSVHRIHNHLPRSSISTDPEQTAQGAPTGSQLPTTPMKFPISGLPSIRSERILVLQASMINLTTERLFVPYYRNTASSSATNPTLTLSILPLFLLRVKVSHLEPHYRPCFPGPDRSPLCHSRKRKRDRRCCSGSQCQSVHLVSIMSVLWEAQSTANL